MADFESHLPIKSHHDGDTFTPSSDAAVAVGGYESISGDFLAAGVTAGRAWLVSDVQLTALTKAEDSAHVSGDKGIMSLAVRNDTKGALAGTDGDYIPFQMNASGELYTVDEAGNVLLGTIDADTSALVVSNAAILVDTTAMAASLVSILADTSALVISNAAILVDTTAIASSVSSIDTSNAAIQVAVEILDNIVHLEDAAHVSGDSGAFMLAVANHTEGALHSDDGDYAALQVDASGRLRIVGDVTLGNLEKEEDTAHVSGDIGVMMLGVRQDSAAALAGDGDYIPFSINADGALRVSLTDPGESATEVNDYNTSAAVAVSASANHDYTVTALKTLKVFSILASASGRIKVEVFVDGVSKFVEFNSTANPNIEMDIQGLLEVAAGDVIRIAITNLEKKDSQDVYSTLLGHEL